MMMVFCNIVWDDGMNYLLDIAQGDTGMAALDVAFAQTLHPIDALGLSDEATVE